MLSAAEREKIDQMTHEELARAWRFEPMEAAFWHGEVGEYAQKRLFTHFGGIPPHISKKIGW